VRASVISLGAPPQGQITARAARRRIEAASVRVRVGSHKHPGANYRACSGFFPYVHGAIVTLGLQRGHSMGQRYLPDGALLRCMKIAAMVAMEFDPVSYKLSAHRQQKTIITDATLMQLALPVACPCVVSSLSFRLGRCPCRGDFSCPRFVSLSGPRSVHSSQRMCDCCLGVRA